MPQTKCLLQISDTHLVADDRAVISGYHNDQSFASVLDLARRHHARIDAILATGDLSDDGSIAAYDRLAWHFSQLDVPVLCLPGNHDTPDNMRLTLNKPPIRYLGNLNLGSWLIVSLNSHVSGEDGGLIATDDLDSLKHTLAGHGGPVLIAIHHPPLLIGSQWLDTVRISNSNQLFIVLSAFPNVKAVIFGHIHQSFSVQLGQLQLLGCPSTTRQFRPHADRFAVDNRAPGYRWLHLGPRGGLRTGVRRLNTSVSHLIRQSE